MSLDTEDFFDYEPKTEAECLNLLEEGEYEFEVLKQESAISKKSGCRMIKLTLNVFDKNGNPRQITDYLVNLLDYKIRHFCDTTGLIEEYNSRNFKPSMCPGKKGFLKIKIDIDITGNYPPKNSVKDYVKRDKTIFIKNQNTENLVDDEIPF